MGKGPDVMKKGGHLTALKFIMNIKAYFIRTNFFVSETPSADKV